MNDLEWTEWAVQFENGEIEPDDYEDADDAQKAINFHQSVNSPGWDQSAQVVSRKVTATAWKSEQR